MDLRESIEAAVDATPTDSAPVASPTPAPAAAPSTAAPIESESHEESTGTGETPAEGDRVALSEVPAGEPKSITEVVAKEEVGKPGGDPRIDRAPASWKGEAKKVWAELPLQARQEVIRRERDTATVLRESATAKQQLSAVQSVFAPHMGRIQSMYGGDPVAAISNLLRVEQELVGGSTQSKAEFVAKIVKQFNVDIRALDSALSGQEMPPEVSQTSNIEQLLNQRLAPVLSYFEQQQAQQRQQVQQQEQQVAVTVEQMASDPQFPYFNDVRDDMADLIEIASKKGLVLTLPEAYNKAVRMNDTTYDASSARSQSVSATQQALAAHQQAQRAKGAAVSVSGSPNGLATRDFSNPADLRGLISQAFDGIGESRL